MLCKFKPQSAQRYYYQVFIKKKYKVRKAKSTQSFANFVFSKHTTEQKSLRTLRLNNYEHKDLVLHTI
jgi:hypothetical protein